MIPKRTYRLSVLLLLLFLSACINRPDKKTDWDITLSRKDKKPYGSFLAYRSLEYFFPHSKIIDLSPGFRYSSMDEKMIRNPRGRSLLIALGLDFYLSGTELKKLVSFASEGNEIVIFARVLDDKLEQFAGCTIKDNGYEETALTGQNNGSININSLSIREHPGIFGYQGRSVLASFMMTGDSSRKEYAASPPDTLGFAKKNPNIIRYKVGEGHITLHAGPLVMSNYFLLQRDNREYLETLWNTLPDHITKIYWNDYYKRSTKAADLSVLLKYPATKWAFIIAVFTFLVYLVFESKRRQRIIPEIRPLENSSVSFVETVGRLYYNKGNHTNIGEKMIQHFLEWIRTHYFMNTNKFDERFSQQLTLKSGLPEPVIRSMMEMIREIHVERKPIDEQDLYHLHQTIQQFYKNHKS